MLQIFVIYIYEFFKFIFDLKDFSIFSTHKIFEKDYNNIEPLRSCVTALTDVLRERRARRAVKWR